MNFTGINFSIVPDNSYAYIAFDLEYGFRLLEERRDSNAVYFRDLNDADPDGISNTPITANGIIVKSNLIDYSSSLSSLEDRVGGLIKIGDTWATILTYNSSNSATVDNYPAKLPPIQSITPGSPGVITVPAHGLANNTPIKFSGNNMPGGLTAGTTYYVRNATTNTFNISTTSGGASIAITAAGLGEVFVSRIYSVFLPTLDTDKIKDTIIGKVTRSGTTYTVESYYDVSGESVTTLELVPNLDNLFGDYDGQIVLNSQDNQVYTWNGVAWIIGTGQSARSVSLSVTKQAFEYTAAGNLVGTPTSTVTASVINATGNITYDFKVDGVSVGSSPSYEYTPNALYSEMPDVISVDIYEDGVLVASDLITMYGVLDGTDAITAILSNEAHTVPASNNGDVISFVGSGTKIQVFLGSTELQYVASNPTSGQFTLTATGSNITPGAVTADGLKASVADHSAMDADVATITYSINVEGTVTVTKVQSITKSKQGEPGSLGEGAAAVKLDATTYVVTYNADGTTPNPSTNITLTAVAQNIDTPWFKFTGGGAGFDEATFTVGSGNEDTKLFTVPTNYFSTPYKLRVDVSNGDQNSLTFDTINILAVKPGLDAIVGLLTNESHTVASDSDGNNYSLGTAGGTFLVYDGITNVTTSATFGGGTTQNGLTISINSSGVYTLSGASWTSDSESFTLTATYKGVTITKIYTITKSKAGVIGADADYVLVTGEQSFKFLSGSTTPINSTIVLSAQLFGSLTTYDWEFWDATETLTWINLSGTQNQQTYTLAYDNPAFTENSLRVRCISGGKFDEITIVKLFDGEDTLSGYLTNENHTVPATFSGGVTQPNLDLAGGSFKVYEGLSDITSSATFSGSATKNGLALTINSGGVYSLSGTSWSSDTETFTLTATYKGVTISKVYTISKSKAGVDGTGSDGVVINLSNDNVTVPANFDGSNPNLTGAVTQVFIYEGTFDTTNQWSITATPSLGVTGNLVGANYTVTGLTTDSGTVTFTATRSGYSNQTIVFTISKAKGGQDGSPATVYEVRASVDAVRKDVSDIYSPTSVTFNAFSITGNSLPIAYSGRFIVSTSVDGITFTTRYTSSVNQSSYTYTLIPNINFVRVNLYLAGGTATLLDSETIPIISDGATGSAGTNARSVNLTAGTQTFTYNAAGSSPNPSSTIVTATAYNTSGTVYYEFLVNGSSVANTTASTRTITAPVSIANTNVEVRIRENSTTGNILATDQITITGIRPGSNAITTILSNEAHTIPTDSAGNNGNYTGSGTTIRVFEGATPLTYETGTGFPTNNSRFRIIKVDSNITSGAISGTGSTTATVGNASNMIQNIASVTYTINIKTSVGQEIQNIKVQTFSKSRAGVNGVDGVDGARGAGRWHISVTSLPSTSTDAQTAWNTGVFVGISPGVQVQGDQAWFFTGTFSNPTGQSVWIYSGSQWNEQDEVIDGNLLVTGTITGDKVAANTIEANKLNVTQLSAITATIGTLRTAETGARTEIKDNLIEVYDATRLRVRLGIWT
jgi:hypothetical protein